MGLVISQKSIRKLPPNSSNHWSYKYVTAKKSFISSQKWNNKQIGLRFQKTGSHLSTLHGANQLRTPSLRMNSNFPISGGVAQLVAAV